MKTKPLLSISIITILVLGIFPLTVHGQPLPDLPDVSQAPFKVRVIEGGGLKAYVQPWYTTFGDPASYVTPAGEFSGVGKLILTRTDFTVGCSGALLAPTGKHVLTAAHCVTDDRGNLNLISGFVEFQGTSTIYQINVVSSSTSVHSGWDGDVLRGNDIAVLTLLSEAPAEITRYGIDRVADGDVGAIGDKAGYGKSGNGNVGSVLPFGIKRDGQNKYDDVADTMLKALGLISGIHFVPGSVVQYDFDNGNSQNDGFGFFFNKRDLGVGAQEVDSAPGDSGGPTLTGGVISGITSYGIRLQTIFGTTTDVDGSLNSSFGEFAGDTRVSQYVSFVDGVLGGGGTPVPVPTISINDVAKTEGNFGTTTNFVFTVTRSGDTTGTSSVNFVTADGTATAGSDYVINTGTLNFAASQTTGTITIVVNGDNAKEKNETFFVNLSTCDKCSITDNQGKGTIRNDDRA